MSTIAVNNILPSSSEDTSSRNLVETIAYRKANDLALSCFQSLVYCFLVLFSCCCPSYQRIYETELSKRQEKIGNRVGEVAMQSLPQSPRRRDTTPSSPRIEPRPTITEPQTQIERPPVAAQAPSAPSITERQTQVERPPAAALAPSAPLMLKDHTARKIAQLRPSEETNAEGKPYQCLFLRSENTGQHHKVILFDQQNQPPQLHLDLSNGDYFDVSEGLWIGNHRQILIFIQNGRQVKSSYTIDLPPQPIDYRNPNGEKIYITDIISANFETGLKYDQENRERFCAIFPNLFPPIEADIEPGAFIGTFARKGKLYDFTLSAIDLEISDEPHAENEEPYEYLTLNKLRVILYRSNPEVIRMHFDLQDDEDAIVIKARGENALEIEEHTGPLKEVQHRYVLNTKHVYTRKYTNASGEACTEKVYITGIGPKKLENDKELQEKLSLIWPSPEE